jgi:hypothetical protein
LEREGFADFCDAPIDGSVCAGFCPAQLRLEFGESFFNGVEIGTVGGQRPYTGTCRFDCHTCGLVLVGGQIVPDDDVARLQGGSQDLLNPCPEQFAVHGTAKSAECSYAGGVHCGNAGDYLPLAMGRLVDKALALLASPIGPDEIGGDGSLVDEQQRGCIHAGLFCNVGFTRLGNVGSILLAGVQGFF